MTRTGSDQESKIPPRLTWAVEQLAVRPSDRVLEVGCGPGLAASLVCARLAEGHLTAIDRSSTAIDAARRRNSVCIASGKATFLVATLTGADLEAASFDRAYAINVNVFWLEPTAELVALRRVLKRDGFLLLVYHPPAASKVPKIAAVCSRFLHDHGFSRVTVEVNRSLPIPMVSISGYA